MEGSEFNNLYFMIEKFSFNRELIMDRLDNNRTFLLKNVLIELDGFILVRGSKMLLEAIMWVG
jgi:hypothetical protein